MEEQIRRLFRSIPERKAPATRIRLHDDLRLEQLLYTGKDFVFVGFGGRADRPLSERRIKRSPLRDVASLLLSFDYAAHAVLFDQVPGVTRRPETVPSLEFWAGYWSEWVSAMFLKSYFECVDTSALRLPNDADVRLLLDAFLMERALEEIGRELMDRPEWVRIPVRMILRVLDARRPAGASN
jgi:maltose alpha-D-glucosyltransferase/alpha-amylase